jgi:hypothetical protein
MKLSRFLLMAALVVLFLAPHAFSRAQDSKYVAALDFQVPTNGFSFENYGGDSGYSNLVAEDMQRMFGDVVCASMEGGCILTPPAQQWMEQQNNDMNGGHCQGMAVLSDLFFLGKADPTPFGGDSASALQITDNEALQREIAYYWAYQIASPRLQGAMSGNDKTPNDILDGLMDAFNNPSGEQYTIALFQRNGEGGHAITPYAVADAGDGKYKIMVYDNNWPGQERSIEIDKNANTWQYIAATNPNEPDSLYEGDADTKSLALLPVSANLEQPPCPMCQEIDNAPQTGYKPDGITQLVGFFSGVSGSARAQEAKGFHQLWMEGDGELYITDNQGRVFGQVDGKFVRDIPGVQAQPLLTGDLWKEDTPPVFYIPVGMDFTAHVSGKKLKQDSKTSLLLLTDGYYLGVDDIALSPGQEDALTIPSTADSMTYETTSTESPIFILGWNGKDADYAFGLAGVDMQGGGVINIGFDLKKGWVGMSSEGSSAPATYGLLMNRIDKNGEQTFGTDDNGIALDPKDTVYIEFDKWGGDKGSLPLLVDKGSTGNISETIDLQDVK